MSTKDLIDRLTRTSAGTRSTRTAPAGPTPPTGERKETRTRVGARVIRRRKKATPPPAAPVLETRAAAPPKARPPEPAPAAAPVEPKPEPVVQAAAPTPAPAPQPVATPEPPKPVEVKAAAPTPPPAEKPAPVVAKPVDAKPDPKPVDAKPADVKPVDVKPVDVQPVATKPVSDAPKSAPTPQPKTVAAAEKPEAPVAEKPETPAKPAAQVPVNAHRIARGLPRADGSRPTAPRSFPGLGSAVVRPPPGYDPDDPGGNRRRAQAAAAASQQARAPAGEAGGRVWRDQKPVAAAAPAADRRPRRTPAAPAAPAGRRPPNRGRRRVAMYADNFPRQRRRGKGRAGPKKASPQAAAHKRRVEVDGAITVALLAHGMSVKAGQVIKVLMGLGQMATMNDTLDFDTATLVATEFEFEAVNSAFQEDDHMIQLEDIDEDAVERPPVVTIMGHVDHGKTTLLDAIRKANVAGGEAGGITQHTAAYQVTHNGAAVTFIDTPGHAAFTEMRARGAQCTDIVVLVVAADDGVMPQTVEALNHAKAAGVQILVAVNKCDKADAQPDRVKQELLAHELVAEDYGGDTMFVNVSALKGQGLPELLEAIHLLAEVGEYVANPDRHAEGTVLEARLERGMGAVATLLVQKGTLKPGNRVVIGTSFGRVRAMNDHRGKRIKTAGPSTPVEIMGLSEVPLAGDNFVVVGTDKDAKALAQHRVDSAKQAAITGHQRMTLEDLLKQGAEGEKSTLNLIIKTDVGGTLEAIKGMLAKLEVEGAEYKLLHAAVGPVSESDVTLAHTNGAMIVAFNVRPDSKARPAIANYGVNLHSYSIIYELIDDIEKAMKGLLGPSYSEKVQSRAEVRALFKHPKAGTIAGCMISSGKIGRNHQVRLIRKEETIWEGRLASMRRFKEDVREVKEGYECGLSLDGFNDIQEGDVLESFTMEAVAL